MNDARYKKLMEQVGLPDSQSLLGALQQVANEVEQEVRATLATQPSPAPSVDVEKVLAYVRTAISWLEEGEVESARAILSRDAVAALTAGPTPPDIMERVKGECEKQINHAEKVVMRDKGTDTYAHAYGRLTAFLDIRDEINNIQRTALSDSEVTHEQG